MRAIETHIFKQYYRVRQYFFIYRFVSERKRQAVIEQTRFLDTVFLCSEFRLEYPGVNFCGKNLCDNFYLRELNFCGSLKKKNPEKSQKLEPRKILCHTVVERQQKSLSFTFHW